MARRRAAEKREITPDPVYGDLIIAKFINSLMLDGKKSIAEKVVYKAIDQIDQRAKAKDQAENEGGEEGGSGTVGFLAPVKISKQGYETFRKAIENVSPLVEVRAKRVGGATYQVPVEIRAERRLTLAIRWLIDAAVKRVGKSLAERLAAEIRDAVENRGAAFKKREDAHRMANSNKAYAHIRA